MNKTTAHKLGIALAGVLALIVLPARVNAAALAYIVTVLDSPGLARGINNSGQVVGTSQVSGDFRAVVWNGTTPTFLSSVGLHSEGNSINDAGQVAGVSGNHAVRWTGTTAEDLGPVGVQSYGHGINASGQVAGFISGGSGAVVWNGTTPTFLSGGGVAMDINDSGQIVGNRGGHAAMWSGAAAIDLGTLGGVSSAAFGINASGQVVGSSLTTANEYHAVMWNSNSTTPIDLGTLGGSSSRGFAINIYGDVVGMAFTAGYGTEAPFLYTGGTMYNLNLLLLPGSGVTNLTISNNVGNTINDHRQIAAFGNIGGQTRALRLDPVVPEPASAALLLGGGALLGLRRRRK